MMKSEIEKRGEITTKQLVTIIILILSFSVILFLIFRLDLGSKSNAEICRNSVLLQEKSGLGQGGLDCRTSYVCISGSGDCDGFSSTSEIKVNTKDDTMEALAEEMVSCWWQFGEGEVEYSDTAAFEKVSCAVCSVTRLEDLDEEISYEEFYDYLSENKKSNSQTYLQYLYSTDSINDLEDLNIEKYINNKISPGEEYFILTGVAEDGYFTARAPWNLFKTSFDSYPVVILENNPENYDEIECDQFVTKA